MDKIILASGSPRRIELFKKNNVEFQVLISDIEENVPEKSKQGAGSNVLGVKKALDIENKVKEGIIIAADTIVYKDEILMKPKDLEDARYILNKLSGTDNDVITAVAVVRAHAEQKIVFYETSKVFFKKMSQEDIEEYIATGEVWDKAGAYAIQGIGNKYIERIEGDYLNILGLPWDRLIEILKGKFNIELVSLND